VASTLEKELAAEKEKTAELTAQLDAELTQVRDWKQKAAAVIQRDADTIASLKQRVSELESAAAEANGGQLEALRSLKFELSRRDREVHGLMQRRKELHQLIAQLPAQFSAPLSLASRQQQHQQSRDVLDDLFMSPPK
jgi:chromosome segregation ATPase